MKFDPTAMLQNIVSGSANLKGHFQPVNIQPHYGRKTHGIAKQKMPAEIAGIKIEGQNKWITVIQNASKLQN
jgi:hypothetical protein